jgi:membrane protease YdiL (CAAX protease family)/tetratricopeptide (TPR) repeat protein
VSLRWPLIVADAANWYYCLTSTRAFLKSAILAYGLVLLMVGTACSQTAKFETDHQVHLKRLGSAKDSLYTEILSRYDQYISAHPESPTAQLERCKLIEKSYYDSYEDYNPNYEEAEGCATELAERFPDTPEVLLYRAEFLFGDSLQAFLKRLELKAGGDEDWKPFEWQVYERLANTFRYTEGTSPDVIHYAELAMAENDTLDLSIMLAEAYQENSRREAAIEVLLNKLDSTDDAWILNQKGELLRSLDKPDEALRAFGWASKDEDMEDASAVAKAMIDKGLIEGARPYLLKDYQKTQQWNPDRPARALLEYDLRYGVGDSAVVGYRRLTQDNFTGDTFGVYRLRLFAKAPLAGWTFADFARLGFLALLLCVIFIVPYLWVLPIHYWGMLRKRRGVVAEIPAFDWGLRHLWVACALWLTCDTLAMLLFDYGSALSYFSDYHGETLPGVNEVSARLNLFFMTGNAVYCLAMVGKPDLRAMWKKIESRHIWMGIALALTIRIVHWIAVLFLKSFGVEMDAATGIASAITDAVVSINTFYSPWIGFLLVAIVVPLYEEVLFRGIFLSAAQRNMKFIMANSLQAIAFALVHQNLWMIPFYFTFAAIAGHYTRKTGSLTTGIAMHIMNNLIAFVAILFVKG